MTTAELTVALPEGLWIADVSRDHPESTFRVIAGIPGDRDGYALARILSPAAEEILEDTHGHPDVTHVDRMHTGEADVTVQVQTADPLLLFSAQESGIPIVMPFDIRDGYAEVRVIGSRSRVSELGRQFDRNGLAYEIDSIREELPADRGLSDRQLDVLLTAAELGYYDFPRRATQAEVAAALGIAKSTCSETLQRAEGTLIARFVEQLPDHEQAVRRP